jgi:hypothetical protein
VDPSFPATEQLVGKILSRRLAQQIRFSAAQSPFEKLYAAGQNYVVTAQALLHTAGTQAKQPYSEAQQVVIDFLNHAHQQQPTLSTLQLVSQPLIQAFLHTAIQHATQAAIKSIHQSWDIAIAAGLRDGQDQLAHLNLHMATPTLHPTTPYLDAITSDLSTKADAALAKMMAQLQSSSLVRASAPPSPSPSPSPVLLRHSLDDANPSHRPLLHLSKSAQSLEMVHKGPGQSGQGSTKDLALTLDAYRESDQDQDSNKKRRDSEKERIQLARPAAHHDSSVLMSLRTDSDDRRTNDLSVKYVALAGKTAQDGSQQPSKKDAAILAGPAAGGLGGEGSGSGLGDVADQTGNITPTATEPSTAAGAGAGSAATGSGDSRASSLGQWIQQAFQSLSGGSGSGAASASTRGYSTGSQAAYRAATDAAGKALVVEQIWVVEFSAGTCAECAAMHGQIMSLDSTFDASSFALNPLSVYNGLDGPPRHPWCFPASTRVDATATVPESAIGDLPGLIGSTVSAVAGSERHFVGEFVTIETARGHQLTGTVNHPVATSRGWVALTDLVLGDYVLSSTDAKWDLSSNPDNDQVIPTIQQVVDTFGGMSVLAGDPSNFHGDGSFSPTVVRTHERVPTGSADQLGPTDVIGFCQGLLTDSADIELDQVVRITRDPASVHVFSLQTETGWYVAEGIVVKNCGCVVLPFIDGSTASGQLNPVAMRRYADQWADQHKSSKVSRTRKKIDPQPSMLVTESGGKLKVESSMSTRAVSDLKILPGDDVSVESRYGSSLVSDDVRNLSDAKYDNAVDHFRSCAIDSGQAHEAREIEDIVPGQSVLKNDEKTAMGQLAAYRFDRSKDQWFKPLTPEEKSAANKADLLAGALDVDGHAAVTTLDVAEIKHLSELNIQNARDELARASGAKSVFAPFRMTGRESDYLDDAKIRDLPERQYRTAVAHFQQCALDQSQSLSTELKHGVPAVIPEAGHSTTESVMGIDYLSTDDIQAVSDAKYHTAVANLTQCSLEGS